MALCVMAERLRAPTQALVFLISRVCSNLGRGTCVLEQDTLPLLLCPSDGTLSRKFRVLGLVEHIRTLILEVRG